MLCQFNVQPLSTDLAHLDNIQYSTAKLGTGAYHLTRGDKLNFELGWESIEKRCDILSLNIFNKIHRCETRPLIRSCMPITDIEKNIQAGRKGGIYPSKTLTKSLTTLSSHILHNFGIIFQIL